MTVFFSVSLVQRMFLLVSTQTAFIIALIILLSSDIIQENPKTKQGYKPELPTYLERYKDFWWFYNLFKTFILYCFVSIFYNILGKIKTTVKYLVIKWQNIGVFHFNNFVFMIML